LLENQLLRRKRCARAASRDTMEKEARSRLREGEPMSNAEPGILLREIRKLADQPAAGGPPDRLLLEQFIERRDEQAFALLVARHGPMVLGVSRSMLQSHHDAEDAFQATFLVLARKAGSIRSRESVGSFLHGVACRLARNVQASARRRRFHEMRAP